MEEEWSNPYMSSWRGKGKDNHISRLTRHSTYMTAEPDEELDYYYIKNKPSPRINTSGRPEQSTFSNLVNSYVVKGQGNNPIGVRPIFHRPPQTKRAVDLSGKNVNLSGQYPVYDGSNSPSTHYERRNQFTSRASFESGYEGSFSPETKTGNIYGGDSFVITDQGRGKRVLGNVSLPTRDFAAKGDYKPKSYDESGNYGVSSAGNDSSYGGSSPGFSPSSATKLTTQNYSDRLVTPRYTL